jgi:AraC-like DNA-binding protein
MQAFFDLLKPNELIYPNSAATNWLQGAVKRPYGHPYYHWIQTSQGSGKIKIKQHELTLSTGQGILIAPFVPHDYDPDGFWQTDYLTISGLAASFLPKMLGSRDYYLINDIGQIREALHQLVESIANDATNTVVASQTFTTLLYLRDAIQQTYHSQENSMPIYWEIKAYIDEYYSEPLTVNQLSTHFHISPQYLIKMFKKAIDVSPYQYLLNKRIAEAKKLLVTQHELSIAEIGSLVGIDNPSQFIARFKAQVHCTPLEFRSLFYMGSDMLE